MENSFDVVVIGGGPSGLSAAARAAHCGWKTLLIDKQSHDGYLANLKRIFYFPAFPGGISGSELVDKMRSQATNAGATIVEDTVSAISADERPIKLTSANGVSYEARACIVATGSSMRTSTIKGEHEFAGRGVFCDANMDGPFMNGKIAAVVGKNRLAAKEAIALTRFASSVKFLIPSNKLDADEELNKLLQSNKKIEMSFSTSLKEIRGGESVSSISLFTGGKEAELKVDGIFLYTHDFKAATSFLGKAVELGDSGGIKVDRRFASSAEGIFACGDCLCGRPQLPYIAAAQGLLAGIEMDRYLAEQK